MNLIHLKYAVEVADAGSINKAAERLFMGQPNLSRAIKELEASLGISIFDRSVKGMVPTPEGEEFLGYARQILRQLDQIESVYHGKTARKQTFSISVPRASYIADAFARFSKNIGPEPAEIFYQETNSLRAIENILHSDYKLGIIRYASNYKRYFKAMLEEKELNYELITEFRYVLIMGKEHPLAQTEEILLEDLRPYIEIAHADPYVPSLPMAEVRKSELPADISRRIFVFERAGQFDLLAENPETFMWVSPIPEALLRRYDLVQRPCANNQRTYHDVLVYRKNYRLSKLDRQFITELTASRRRHLEGVYR
ncbi:MAG: LysR family transcriptional regulator [Oscillospiraceae bacterium]|jgi:DNA-binding transcriptional LysR family regulator|nr:LysR family transcriptional regulator [Oscillospiraceae bacterium]MBR4657163.1 LysR family transcriptional regulator [Oscillospiraceae bacterium]